MKPIIVLVAIANASFALTPAEEAKTIEVARAYIKDYLKAPAAPKFSKESICAPLGKADFEEAKGTGPTPECTKQKSDKVGDRADHVVYRGSVDAKDPSGALIRTKYQLSIYVDAKGKWIVNNEADDVKLLYDDCVSQKEKDCKAQYPNAPK